MPIVRSALVTVLFSFSLGCSSPEPPPVREPVGILYVAVPELRIRQQPNDQSPLVATYLEGESVSVYALEGEWAEVQLYEDRSGWARKSELTTVKEMSGGPGGPRFRKRPSPVWTQRKVHGEIVLEATVSSGGQVLSVRTLTNTTGDPSLEAMNRAELSRAAFHPLVRGGRPQPFVYEYRVTY